MKTIPITLLALITTAAAGCVSPPLPGNGDGGAVSGTPTTGLYDLLEQRTSSCTPRPLDSDSLRIGLVGFRAQAVRVTFSQNFHQPPQPGTSLETIDVVDGHLALDLSPCNANLHRTLTIDEQSETAVRATMVDTWSGLTAADPSCAPVLQLPATDCVTTTTLQYNLRQTCPQSCLQLDPNGFLNEVCSCPAS